MELALELSKGTDISDFRSDKLKNSSSQLAPTDFDDNRLMHLNDPFIRVCESLGSTSLKN